MSSAMPISTTRALPASSVASTRSCATGTSRSSCRSIVRAAIHPARRDRAAGRRLQRHRRHGHRHGRQHGRGARHGVAARFRSERRPATSTADRPSSTGRRSASTRWARSSRSLTPPWRSTRARRRLPAATTPPTRSRSAASPSMTTIRSGAGSACRRSSSIPRISARPRWRWPPASTGRRNSSAGSAC